MEEGEAFEVEVAYATPTRQVVLRISVRPPCTAERAVRESGILDAFPGLAVVAGRIGIFGEVIDPCHLVEPGDRVELYRPLVNDPKESRRRRASRQRGRREGAS
jgi:putative ubiquitin-RnfH superfamily antitoxin RatB of RatAB toxin-antitoxin module